MMDPISIIGLVSAIISFITFGGSIMRSLWKKLKARFGRSVTTMSKSTRACLHSSPLHAVSITVARIYSIESGLITDLLHSSIAIYRSTKTLKCSHINSQSKPSLAKGCGETVHRGRRLWLLLLLRFQRQRLKSGALPTQYPSLALASNFST